jgi:hypothetical protein
VPQSPLIPILAIGGGAALLLAMSGGGKKAPTKEEEELKKLTCPLVDTMIDPNTGYLQMRRLSVMQDSAEAAALQLGVTKRSQLSQHRKALMVSALSGLTTQCNWDLIIEAYFSDDANKIGAISANTMTAIKAADTMVENLRLEQDM